FSTGDEIIGEALITATDDFRIDDLDISFTGYSQTSFDSIAASLPSTTEKRFLHLQQPTEASICGSVLKANHTYTIPFKFIVPDRLLPSACSCKTYEDHLVLPPTVGGEQCWKRHGKILDDPTPEMAKISYKITATLAHRDRYNHKSITRSSRAVCVIPNFFEAPPLIPSTASEYRFRQEKPISRGLFMGKLGHVVMEAHQPNALKCGLLRPGSPASTTLILRYDPSSENCTPPVLDNIKRKIQAVTLFQGGQTYVADKKTPQNLLRPYHETMSLSALCVSGMRWQKLSPTWAHEQLLHGDTPCLPTPSSGYTGGVYYLLRLSLPVELPESKALVPTFYSCLVSRFYRMEISLALSTTSSLSVCVPLQLC
ncbi:uncharacterized protein K452DRAFT_205454, partial [Aplosporella prunicola CBS 121167]